MLKNLHVITGIIFALTIFCLLQVVTGGLFYSAVSNDRHNFQNSGVLNAQQESLSDSVNTLVKTRVTVTRVAIRYLKNQRDPASLAAINKLLGTAADSLAKAEAYNKEWQKLPQVNGQEATLTDEMQKSWNQMHEVMRLSISICVPTTIRPMAIWTRSRRRTKWRRSITAGAPITIPC